MKAPLTDKRVAELHEKVRSMTQQAGEHDRLAGEAEWQVNALSAAVAAMKPEAIKQARDLRASKDERDLMAAACRREAELAQRELDEDEPNRIARKRAKRVVAAKETALRFIAVPARADDLLRQWVDCLRERRTLAAELQQFSDICSFSLPDIGHYIDGILGNSGLASLLPNQFRGTASESGPTTLAQIDAQALAQLLPADHPAVVENQRRQDAVNAAYRRSYPQAFGDPTGR